jgi:hypothetical protein
MNSTTYKFKIPDDENAIYFTVVKDYGKVQALFLNSKQMKNYQWISALMTSYTRQMQAGISAKQIIDDMKNTFDHTDHILFKMALE